MIPVAKGFAEGEVVDMSATGMTKTTKSLWKQKIKQTVVFHYVEKWFERSLVVWSI